MADSLADKKQHVVPFRSFGRTGNPKMNRAVEARETDPEISLLDALLAGGFVFPEIDTKENLNPKKLYDTDGVSLYQRKNQLMRRLRTLKQRGPNTASSKIQGEKAEESCPSPEICQSYPPSTMNDINEMPPSKGILNNVETERFDVYALDEISFDKMIYPQDEKREHFSLSEREKAEIASDLFGKTEISNACLPASASEILDFDEALNEVDMSKKRALAQAQIECPSIVCDEQKKMFLRWADFDVKQAADRFVLYWNMRQHLFALNAFLRLTLDQISDEVTLQARSFRLLPQKDNNGRAIIWVDPSRLDFTIHKRESEIKYLWCIIHKMLEDEIVQEKGFIFLVYGKNVHILKNFDRGYHKMLWGSINEWLPVKLKALHFIRAPPFVSLVLPIMKYLWGHKVRHRTRFHNGENEEILESLLTYGIPQDTLPREIGGHADLKRCTPR